MAFRASGNGATELQTAKFISTIYLPVTQLWGRHRHPKTVGDFSARQVAKLKLTAELGQKGSSSTALNDLFSLMVYVAIANVATWM
jgi:hypothetical protein